MNAEIYRNSNDQLSKVTGRTQNDEENIRQNLIFQVQSVFPSVGRNTKIE
jgi:hypothetical protein